MPASRIQPSTASPAARLSGERNTRVNPPGSSECRASASQRCMMRDASSRDASAISLECTLAYVELTEANALGEREFVARFGSVFEHSPWVAQRAWAKRPFRSVDALHQAMMQAVAQAKKEEQLALLRAHPELAGAEAKQGSLTVDSSSEQGRLGFTRLTHEEL